MFHVPPVQRHAAVALALLSLFGTQEIVWGQVRVDAARGAAAQGTAPLTPADQPAGGGALGELAPKMEGDSEYGVQRILYRRSNWEPFNVSFDIGVNYTDNVALVDRPKVDDFFLRSSVHASYTPQITGGLFFNAAVGTEIYRYADLDFFDFDLLSFDAGFLYATPQQGTIFDPIFGDLITYLRYSFYRISEPWDWGEDLFDNHSIVAGFQKTWRISRGHQAYFGVNADWSVDASDQAPRRDEYSAYVGYKIKWTADLESNVMYRAALYDYELFGRSDFNQLIGLGLTYRFTDWLSATASFSAVFNESDRNVFDYESINTGVLLAVQARW
jgi:hypothetical protein